jgi:hypothetical protein
MAGVGRSDEVTHLDVLSYRWDDAPLYMQLEAGWNLNFREGLRGMVPMLFHRVSVPVVCAESPLPYHALKSPTRPITITHAVWRISPAPGLRVRSHP